jgi:hypothetical protein
VKSLVGVPLPVRRWWAAVLRWRAGRLFTVTATLAIRKITTGTSVFGNSEAMKVTSDGR